MQHYQNLIEQLNNATKAYDEGKPYMSDKEWDALYWEVVQWEQTHGIALSHSPTQQIHYEVVNELSKVEHDYPMLSLDKTKSLDELNEFCGNRSAFLSLKLDGLTCRLTYVDGRLRRAETRGNGIVGEDITHNAMVISSIPKRIQTYDKLIVDGEIVCMDDDFAPFQFQYANSRNFAAGSIRLLDSKECEKRNLTFVAWEVVEGLEHIPNTTNKLMELCQVYNFTIVPHEIVSLPITEDKVEYLKTCAKTMGYPIDGLVAKYDDIAFGRSLGMTAHHRRDGLAFKFFDETVVSHLLDIEYEVSRNGELTPVAVFEPVELEGSTISRASLHNLSVMEEVLGQPYVGQQIEVCKKNQIIPQIISSIKLINSLDQND